MYLRSQSWLVADSRIRAHNHYFTIPEALKLFPLVFQQLNLGAWLLN